MTTVMAPEQFRTWSQHLQLTSEIVALVTAIRESPPVRRVRGAPTMSPNAILLPKWAAPAKNSGLARFFWKKTYLVSYMTTREENPDDTGPRPRIQQR